MTIRKMNRTQQSPCNADRMLYPKAASDGSGLDTVGERWRSHRPVASWYLWQHIDGR